MIGDNMEQEAMNNNRFIQAEEPAPEEKNPIDYKGLSILKLYGEDLTAKQYITNPAIAREEEIARLTMILLTPEKSCLLTI